MFLLIVIFITQVIVVIASLVVDVFLDRSARSSGASST
jgi:hypothetical protein